MPRYPLSAWRTFRPEAVGVALSTPVRCRILGLDPGSQRTGYGILDCTAAGERHVANGCINVTGGELSVRLRRIFEAISVLIQEHRPDEIAIERVFVHRNPDSALKLGQARGAALCAAVALGAPAHEYAPRAIKLAVTGYGAADKRQVSRMVATLLTLGTPPGADAADALAVALCHAQGRRLAALAAAPRGAARRSGASP
jgi:crossover junction endodeoxyribonuclease RuvC